MSQKKHQAPKEMDTEYENPFVPVRYSLPRMLVEVARDREAVREIGKLLNQDQIDAIFSTRTKGGND